MPPRRKISSTSNREPPYKRSTRQSSRLRSDSSDQLKKSQPKQREENVSLPDGDRTPPPKDVSPVATSFKSLVAADNVVVEPILSEIDSDVEVTPAKVINEVEWNAGTTNNNKDYDNDYDEDDDDDGDDYGKKLPAERNIKTRFLRKF